MLKMISSSAFIENGQPRPPIIFHKGLNAILGLGSNSNSIGKSTLLMIIDFCFGGEDYTEKESDTIKNIGHHTITFEFEFDNETYKFERSTENPNNVVKYDSKNSKTFIGLTDFRSWLLYKYKLERLNLSFRQTVSRFFRIYNRGTYNELRPLNATVREDDKTGILSMLKLFNIISNLDSLVKKLDELKEIEITYNNLKKMNVGNIASSQEEFDANQKEIIRFQNELNELKKDNDLGALDINIIELEEKNQLFTERKKLRTEKRNLEMQKQRIALDKQLDPISLSRNIEKLMMFFPNVEFYELEKIEKFHKDIKKIIDSEVRENNTDIDNLVEVIETQIKDLNLRLENLKETPSISKATLKRYSYVESEILRLTDANRNFLNQKESRNQHKTAAEELKTYTDSKTRELSNLINTKIKEINNQNFPETISPVLVTNGLNSYQFFIPNDTGTGSRYRAVISFDMMVLRETKLPAIAHDSVMITNIDDDKRNRIFNMYFTEKEKQIFIAYDISSIKDEDVYKKLDNSSVIKLSEKGMALFGQQWNRQQL